jgi:SulP family sulfate permease
MSENNASKKINYFSEIISGILIAVILIPETIAYSYLLGVPPSMGIKSTMVMGLLTSWVGTPRLITGATAAVATSLVGVVKLLGFEYISITVILGGLLQLLLGVTGLYKYIIHLPNSVNSGFLIALALLIATSQINNLKDIKGHFYDSNKLCNILLFVLMGLFIIQYAYILFRRFGTELRIPGSVLEIILISMFVHFIPIDIPKIQKIDVVIPSINITKIFENVTLEKVGMTLPFAFAMSVAGLLESMVMVKKTGTNNFFGETMVQGCANILSGLTGGMGGCVLVGESLLNIKNGSKSKIAGIVANITFILCCFFLMFLVNNLSISSIIAIMLYIAYLTGDWAELTKPTGNTNYTTMITALTGFGSQSLTLGVIVGTMFDMISVRL